jgi:transcriptional accessory protein Tex/SPT6
VQYVDEAVAAVWADGAAAKEEMGDQPGSVRSAVALGRCLLEPLPVLASLCGARRLPGFASRK